MVKKSQRKALQKICHFIASTLEWSASNAQATKEFQDACTKQEWELLSKLRKKCYADAKLFREFAWKLGK